MHVHGKGVVNEELIMLYSIVPRELNASHNLLRLLEIDVVLEELPELNVLYGLPFTEPSLTELSLSDVSTRVLGPCSSSRISQVNITPIKPASRPHR
jgi:hypothetical protein